MPTQLLLAVSFLMLTVFLPVSARAQSPQAQPAGSGISLAPARVELEMQPGSETTIVVDLDYHSSAENSPPVRIVGERFAGVSNPLVTDETEIQQNCRQPESGEFPDERDPIG